MTVDLPADLRAFLGSGRQLTYDPAGCEAGRVTLRALHELRLERFPVDLQSSELEEQDPHRGELGCYVVPAIDLLAGCDGGHDPRGLLLWLPVERRYGTWDPDHGGLLLFGADTTWDVIAAAPAAHLDAQWRDASEDAPVTEPIAPWRHEYSGEQLHEPLPLPGVVR
jgi:hypothetical protein